MNIKTDNFATYYLLGTKNKHLLLSFIEIINIFAYK